MTSTNWISINWRKLLNLSAAVYFALLLFGLFFGFGRSNKPARDSFMYNLSLEPIVPFHFSGLIDNPFMLFQLGNYLAFIPCGLLLAMLLGWGVLRLTGAFLVGILLVETTQMITGLGSFDVNDILLNTLGYLTGYAAWAIGKAISGGTFGVKRTLYTAAAALVLSGGFLVAPSAAERMVQNYAEGEEIGLESLTPSGEPIHWEEIRADLPRALDDAQSADKLYVWSGTGTKSLNYELDGRYLYFHAYGTIEGDSGGGISFIVDGNPIYEFSVQDGAGEPFDVEKIEVDLQGAKQFTIELNRPEEASDGDVLLWDAGLIQRK